jgi:hypothetical protein
MDSSNQPEFYNGEPVEPRDLWFRDDFIATLWETLASKHVLLTGPRRTGKTSVMTHLVEHPQRGFLVVYQNVQDLKHPADLFQTILDNFAEAQPSTFRRMKQGGWQLIKDVIDKIDSINAGGVKVALRKNDADWKANWRALGEDMLSALRRLGVPMLLIVDELPDMILNLRAADEMQAREFVAWLRVNRQTPRPSADTIRWLLAGSINLAGTLDETGEGDAINDLTVEPLPVLSPDEVKEFVQRMLDCNGVAFQLQVLEQVVHRLGQPIPLFLQMASQDLCRLWRKDPQELTAAHVDHVFDALVTSIAARDKLQHYYSRIDKYYPEPKHSAAYAILGALALSDAGGLSRAALEQQFQQTIEELGQSLTAPKRKQAFNQLMQALENDFYIQEIGHGRFDFASGLMKAWWRKYYA